MAVINHMSLYQKQRPGPPDAPVRILWSLSAVGSCAVRTYGTAMATRTISELDPRTVDRLLRVATAVLLLGGLALIFLSDPVLTSIGIVLFILSVITFLGVVKHGFEGHPDW